MSGVSKLALVGLPGTGKSTIGPLLARRLHWRCVDLDERIAARSRQPVPELLATGGEAAFRDLELQALQDVMKEPEPAVIACGGGVMTSAASRELLLETACVVCLDAPDAVLLRRLSNGHVRPLLAPSPDDTLPALRTARERSYAAAHMRVASVDAVECVAEQIAQAAPAIRVPLGSHAYHVTVAPGALAHVALHVPAGAQAVALVADRAVAAQARQLRGALRAHGLRVHVLSYPGGEAAKTWRNAGRLLARLGEARLQRSDCVIAMGGGTIGDLAGFAAATYMRGVTWITVPTTLLAMVDSAIGGKTGLNLPSGKNQAGAFWQPRAVICDLDLLRTLPERAYRAAFAEVIKYAMVLQDGALRRLLDTQLDALLRRDAGVVQAMVGACVEAKASVVAGDELETGRRAILNYGHTIGHALEAASGYGRITHGEAVAFGMRVAGRLSVDVLRCPGDDIAWQDSLLRRCGLGSVASVDVRSVMRLTERDKKRAAAGVGWVLLERRGVPRCGQIVEPQQARRAVEEAIAT